MAVRDGGIVMAEGQVRELLAVLKASRTRASNLEQLIAFSGGMSALEMVLEAQPFIAKTFRENPPQPGVPIKQSFGPNPLEAELNRGLAADKAEQ